MKNIITPEVIKSLSVKPTPYLQISKFLDNNKDVSASYLFKMLDIEVGPYYKWKYRQKLKELSDSNTDTLEIEPTTLNKKKYSADEKLNLIKAFNKLDSTEKPEFFRKYGLYQSDIDRWSELVEVASLEVLSKRKVRSDKKSDIEIEVEELKKKLLVQEKSITKLNALLIIQKKVSEILGSSEND